MAHYDCDNCGDSMGIEYGSCNRCTPSWVREAEQEYKEVVSSAKKKVEEMFKKEQEYIDRRKAVYYNSLVAEAKREFDLTFEAGKDWWKNT